MKKNVLAILSVLALSLAFFSCGSGTGGDSPAKAVEKLYEYIKSKDYDKATNLFYMKEGEKLSEAEAQKIKALLMAGYEEFEKKGGIKDVEIISEKVDDSGESGKVEFKIIFGNGDEKEESNRLNKIDGSWKFKAIGGF